MGRLIAEVEYAVSMQQPLVHIITPTATTALIVSVCYISKRSLVASTSLRIAKYCFGYRMPNYRISALIAHK